MIITLIVVLLVAAFVYWIITLIPLPQPVKNIAIAFCALLLLLYVLTHVLHVALP